MAMVSLIWTTSTIRAPAAFSLHRYQRSCIATQKKVANFTWNNKTNIFLVSTKHIEWNLRIDFPIVFSYIYLKYRVLTECSMRLFFYKKEKKRRLNMESRCYARTYSHINSCWHCIHNTNINKVKVSKSELLAIFYCSIMQPNVIGTISVGLFFPFFLSFVIQYLSLVQNND